MGEGWVAVIGTPRWSLGAQCLECQTDNFRGSSGVRMLLVPFLNLEMESLLLVRNDGKRTKQIQNKVAT